MTATDKNSNKLKVLYYMFLGHAAFLTLLTLLSSVLFFMMHELFAAMYSSWLGPEAAALMSRSMMLLTMLLYVILIVVNVLAAQRLKHKTGFTLINIVCMTNIFFGGLSGLVTAIYGLVVVNEQGNKALFGN